jgi:hypothetical protein
MIYQCFLTQILEVPFEFRTLVDENLNVGLLKAGGGYKGV